MTLAKEYENTKAVGYLTLCNFGGLEILDINCEEAVACFNFGNSREMIRKHKIIYTSSGRAFIRKMGRKYYLGEIMRTNL